LKQLVTRHGQLATIVFVGSFTASLGYVARLGNVTTRTPPPPSLFHLTLPPHSSTSLVHLTRPPHIYIYSYTLTTGRSALMDAKAWLGATTMTDEGVLAECDHRKYQMRLSR